MLSIEGLKAVLCIGQSPTRSLEIWLIPESSKKELWNMLYENLPIQIAPLEWRFFMGSEEYIPSQERYIRVEKYFILNGLPKQLRINAEWTLAIELAENYDPKYYKYAIESPALPAERRRSILQKIEQLE